MLMENLLKDIESVMENPGYIASLNLVDSMGAIYSTDERIEKLYRTIRLTGREPEEADIAVRMLLGT